jgi:hypothetical protein
VNPNQIGALMRVSDLKIDVVKKWKLYSHRRIRHIRVFTLPLVVQCRRSIEEQTKDMFACSQLISEHVALWTHALWLWEKFLGIIDHLLVEGELWRTGRRNLEKCSQRINGFVVLARREVADAESECEIVSEFIEASIAENYDVATGMYFEVFGRPDICNR